MAAERTYELLLAGGGRATWTGADGLDAARRYVDRHREAAVVAWRDAPRSGIFPNPNLRRVVEP